MIGNNIMAKQDAAGKDDRRLLNSKSDEILFLLEFKRQEDAKPSDCG
jgi:hypothetical protein